jgi:hypothetical protein
MISFVLLIRKIRQNNENAEQNWAEKENSV